MAFEEEKLDINFKLQSSLIVPGVSFLNLGLESKKKCATQLTQVISILEGKISRLDERSEQILTDCQKLLNGAIEALVEIFQFQEETKEETLTREKEEWRKEKELLLKESENALIKANAAEMKAMTALIKATAAEKEVLNDLL